MRVALLVALVVAVLLLLWILRVYFFSLRSREKLADLARYLLEQSDLSPDERKNVEEQIAFLEPKARWEDM